jgi:outer membrane protein
MNKMKKNVIPWQNKVSGGTITLALALFLGISGLSVNAQQKLSLTQCRNMALTHNQKLQTVQEQSEMATDLRKSAFTQFLPSFDFTGSYLRTNKQIQILSEDKYLPVFKFNPATNSLVPDLFTVGGQPVLMEDGNPLFNSYAYLPKDQLKMGSKNIYLLNLGLTQPIFLGGKLQSMYRTAKLNEQITSLNYKLETTDVLYKSDEAYWRVVTVKEKLKVAQEYKKLLDKLVADLTEIKSEGIITSNDVLKARVKQSEADLMLFKAQNGLKLSKMALNQQIGLPIDQDVDVEDVPVADTVMVINDSYRNQAIAQRPEIEMLKKSVLITAEAKNIARSRFLPDIALTANYTMSNPNPYNGFVNEFGGDWNLGVIARVPLFHWGDRAHTMNAAKHAQHISELKLDEAQEMISLQVQQAINLYNEAHLKISLAEITYEQAKQNLDQTNSNFQEGIVKSTDVLEAQLLWQKAYNELIDAKSDFRMQETNVQKVLGSLGTKN